MAKAKNPHRFILASIGLLLTALMQDSQNMNSNMNMQIRMAAEDYKGAVRYQVSLHKNRSLLWQSEKRVFGGGHDTEMYGRNANQSELNWQLENLLLTDLDIAGLPSLAANENASASDQLKAIVRHPLFQVR